MPVLPVEVFDTTAVNVTDCPKIDGFAEELTVVEVVAGLTVKLMAPLELDECTTSAG